MIYLEKQRNAEWSGSLIQEYEQTINELLRGLTKKNHTIALEIAEIPEQIRGYDMVKQRHFETAKSTEKKLLTQFRDSAKIIVGLKNSEPVS